ncbi:argininosuccinate lyase [Batrachochytrium salamandrivorans]|nr:argininosuccinate lyase [Batrachochytrium salamandrivorans]
MLRRLSSSSASTKLWGGRFTGAVDPLMEKFNASILFDQRMWKEDLQGSKAYAQTLHRAKLLNEHETKEMVRGLDLVANEWANSKFQLKPSDEDIHTANERRLTELIGSGIAGKLHTGRSRNDQVATDVRLWLRNQVDELEIELKLLLQTMVKRARAESAYLMPGYTHMQPAQPIRWSHWLLAHAAGLERDLTRLRNVRKQVNVMPLGSGAIAGHSFFGPEDRHYLAQLLEFDSCSSNSMDATSDRDFICDFVYWASMTGIHLSRWSEDVIIFATKEFAYVGLADAYSTGSSLMPQKKNPDASELLRGKSGRNIGNLMTLMTVLKGLPMTYNKDLQEDKEPLFDCVDTMRGCLPIATGVVATLVCKPDRMLASLSGDMLATDLADYLVRRGVPFRETHHVAGRAVRLADEKNVELTQLTYEDLKPLHEAFQPDVANLVWSFENSVESRNAQGSTSLRAVLEQCDRLEERLAKL